jgi:hypothetical protein
VKAMNKYVAQKVDVKLTGPKSLQDFYDQWILGHPDEKSITYRQWKEIVALDDWTSIAKTALPYIIEYGPKVVTSLWNKYIARGTS